MLFIILKKYRDVILYLLFSLLLVFIISCGSSGSQNPVIIIPPEEPQDTEEVITYETYSYEGYIFVEENINNSPSKAKYIVSKNYNVRFFENIDATGKNNETIASDNRFLLEDLDYKVRRIDIYDGFNKIAQYSFDTEENSTISGTDQYYRQKFLIKKNIGADNTLNYSCLRIQYGEDKIYRNLIAGLFNGSEGTYTESSQGYVKIITDYASFLNSLLELRLNFEFQILLKYTVDSVKSLVDAGFTVIENISITNYNSQNINNVILNPGLEEEKVDSYRPDQVQNVNISSITYDGFFVSWDITPGADYYSIYDNGELLVDYTEKNNKLLDNLEQERVYNITVKAHNMFGAGEHSDIFTVRTLEVVNPNLELTRIIINPNKISMYTSREYDLQKTNVQAYFKDGTVFNVNNVLWQKASGQGAVVEQTFYSPEDTGETLLRGLYAKNGITKYAFLKINYEERTKILTDIYLSQYEHSMKSGEAFPLSDIKLYAVYDDNTEKEITNFEWEVAGNGEIINNVFYASSTPGETTLTCTVEDDTVVKTAQFTFYVRNSLTSIELDTSEIYLNINTNYDLSMVSFNARYDDMVNITMKGNEAVWEIAEGSGNMDNSIFTTPAFVTSTLIKATYTEDDISQTDYIRIYSGKSLTGIELSEYNTLINVNTTLDMDDILVTATYDDNSSNLVSNISWIRKSGRGMLNTDTNVFYALSSPGSSILECTYIEDGIEKKAEYTVEIGEFPGVPSGLNVSDITENSCLLEWNSIAGVDFYNVYVDDVLYADKILSTYLNITGLVAGREYSLKVSSENTIGESSLSQEITFITVSKPPISIVEDYSDSTSIKISWSIVTGATSYKLFVNGVPKVLNLTNNTYTFNNLISGTTYVFQVSSVNTSGESELSEPTYISTTLRAPVNLIASNITKTDFKLSWNYVTGASGYVVYKDGVRFGPETVADFMLIDEVQPGGIYSMQVASISNGKEGALSISCQVSIIPGVATNLSAVDVTQNTLTLMWDSAEGATTYRVYKEDYAYGSETVNTYYNIGGLASGALHNFRVRSINSSGAGDYSEVFSIYTLPDVPAVLNYLELTSNSFKFIWNGIPGADYYKVYKNGVLLANNVVNTHLFVIGLDADTPYSMQVSSVNAGGESNLSGEMIVVTKP